MSNRRRGWPACPSAVMLSVQGKLVSSFQSLSDVADCELEFVLVGLEVGSRRRFGRHYVALGRATEAAAREALSGSADRLSGSVVRRKPGGRSHGSIFARRTVLRVRSDHGRLFGEPGSWSPLRDL
jgi:hypothetical protein